MPILVTSSVCKVILGEILQKLQGVSQALTEYFIDLIHSYKNKKCQSNWCISINKVTDCFDYLKYT